MASKKKKTPEEAVAAFVADLDDGARATVEALRALIHAAAPQATEHIKWNAPSFCIDGDDRLTLGLEKNGGVRLVLHRGVPAKDTAGFAFVDVDKQAKWPAPDRGVVTVRDAAEVKERHAALSDLVRRWVAATA